MSNINQVHQDVLNRFFNQAAPFVTLEARHHAELLEDAARYRAFREAACSENKEFLRIFTEVIDLRADGTNPTEELFDKAMDTARKS
jgi:hypothetical protein